MYENTKIYETIKTRARNLTISSNIVVNHRKYLQNIYAPLQPTINNLLIKISGMVYFGHHPKIPKAEEPCIIHHIRLNIHVLSNTIVNTYPNMYSALGAPSVVFYIIFIKPIFM